MKLDVIMHYELNELDGSIQFLGKEEVIVDTAKKSVTKFDETEPKLKLNSNNFSLNQKACELLNVSPGNTVHINYPRKDGRYVPAIGASEAFGVKSGNKLTKSLTVSCRGSANQKLSEYGTNFELIESEINGVFYLKGDKIVEASQEDEAIEIDDSFELNDLEDIEIDETKEITKIDFTL